MVSLIRTIFDYVLDVLAILFSWLFQHPTSRYSRRIDSPEDSFERVQGKLALVVEDVTSECGIVRYSGVNWKAKISDEESIETFKSGEEVSIKENNGNLLIIGKR